MTTIPVIIEWSRHQEAFTDNRYSRVHRWIFDGGAEVTASSSPHIVPAPMSDPTAIDPEEAFIASLSSCHMLWFLSIASKRGFRVNGYFDRAVGEMGENDTGRVVITTVRLRPVVDWDAVAPSDAVVAEMHHAAHDQCFIANSVLTNVLIESETN